MTVAILVAISLPGLVRAQSGADPAAVILLHPRVPTVLQLPDAIEHTRVLDRDEIRMAILGDKLYVRPRPGTPAGVEASLDVETRTARWTFRLRVVARARDASREIRVAPVDAQAPEEPPPEEPAEPEVSAEPKAPPQAPAELPVAPLAVTPEAVEPAASAPSSAASPAPPAGLEPAKPSSESNTANMERDTAPADRSRFDLAAHVGAGLGFTGAKVAGYRAETALRPHYSLALRLTGEPRNTCWSPEAEVSGEWPAGPMVYGESGSRLVVSGPRLRLELGMRASLGTKWKTSIYGGIGILVHLRRVEDTTHVLPSTATMEQGAVLALGVGLHYRTRGRVLLGLDFLVRQGGPDDYDSVTMLLTVGRPLDQGD
jgi:hypothetical protein